MWPCGLDCRSQMPANKATATRLNPESNCCLHTQHLLCSKFITVCCRCAGSMCAAECGLVSAICHSHVHIHSGTRPPVPMNMMGLLVAETALMAPPPLAWPSIFVMITEPTCGQRG